MIQLIECVPNFSEGRNQSKVNAIADEISKVQDVELIGLEMDYDHNRSVMTCIGVPNGIALGVYNACLKATELIDLREHQGIHPRIGATDVIPLIPLVNSSMAECVTLARVIGRRIAHTIGIPVFYYGSAFLNPQNEILANIRRGEFERMVHNSLLDKQLGQDVGPSRIHHSAGAVAIGVRDILIAFNINLRSRNIKIARQLAQEIRERDGGLPGVKALGFKLHHEQCVQVSMNITDYRQTSLSEVYRVISLKSHQMGVDILNSELVGLVPEEAFGNATPEDLKMKNMTPHRYINGHVRRVTQNFDSCLKDSNFR